MQQHFHQADDPGVVDLDAGNPGGANLDRQSDALQQGEVDMDVEPLGLMDSCSENRKQKYFNI